MKKKTLFLVFVFLLLSLPSEAVKLVTWNLLNFPGSMGAAREDDFRLVINKLAPDILVTQEMIDLTGYNQFLMDVMNFTIPYKYAAAPFYDSSDTDNALFYRKSTISYLGKTEIQTDLRNITEYRLQVKAERAAGNFDTKKEAVDAGRGIAKNQEPGQLKIHGKDGKIQNEHTYGKDPYPPKG